MKTAQDFAREAVERGIISKANENELELHMLHYMEELLKNWNVANKNCVQPDVSGSLPLAVSSILDKHLPSDGKIGGGREMLRMQIHQDMLKILSGNDR